MPDEVGGRGQRPAGTSRLTVDADAEFDLVRPEAEGRRARGRRRAGSQRDAVAAAAGIGPPPDRHHLVQRCAGGGRRARDLLDNDGRAGAPAPRGVEAVLHRDVVVDEHRFDPDPLVGREVGGHLEIEDVAGVVLHDVHDAGAGVHRGRRGKDLVGHRRGEDLPGAGRVEHARADETDVQRFVAGPAA